MIHLSNILLFPWSDKWQFLFLNAFDPLFEAMVYNIRKMLPKVYNFTVQYIYPPVSFIKHLLFLLKTIKCMNGERLIQNQNPTVV